MRCPRCSFEQDDAPACSRCGVVFAKVRAKETAPNAWPTRPVAAAPPEPVAASPSSRAPLVLGLVALAAVGVFALAGRRRAPAVAPPPVATAPLPGADTPETVAVPSLAPIETAAAPVEAPAAATAIAEEDKRRIDALVLRINAHESLGDADLAGAEDVYARYPAEPALRQVLVAALLSRAGDDQAAQRHAASLPRLQRVLALEPYNLPALRGRVQAYLELADWRGAEGAARDMLARAPGDADALFSLGFALVRQDRGREALDVLQAARSSDPRVTALVDRVQKGLRDEGGMVEQNLSHFHVRYDGGEHDEVGREILRALERHYATLTRTFDHEPQAKVAVILFSRETYNNASGAPAWSGGVYDGLDGKIRIPIGGLDRSLTPDMDSTLIHELGHAFMWDMSRGQAPREIQEGVAQYLEGRRAEAELPERYMRALADGRLGGVSGFYAAALSFTEFLMAQRGQGAMNDVLKTMGSGVGVDAAFERVYGRSLQGMQQEWAQRLRQQHGSN